MRRSRPPASLPGCATARTGGSGSSGTARARDTAGLERALGAIAPPSRLARLYPPTHPAVVESMRQVTAALPALADLGAHEWKVAATGLQWQGGHLLAGDAHVAELAGLLYGRGGRGVRGGPGLRGDHGLALFRVAR